MKQRIEREIKEFIDRGNMLDLAVGIVIGVAFTKVLNSFVNDVLNALIGAVAGKPNFNDLSFDIGNGVVRYGAFLTTLLNFMIVGFGLYLVVKGFNTWRRNDHADDLATDKDVLIEIRDLLARDR
ncbi:MAG: large conductance mechanosensitive channel protein MscL [Acidimicrobiia bacterium]